MRLQDSQWVLIATASEDDGCAFDPTNDTIRVGGAATPAASCAPTGTASNYSHTGVNTITTGGGFSGSAGSGGRDLDQSVCRELMILPHFD